MDFSSGLGDDFPCAGTAGVGLGGSDLDEGRWESNGGEGDLMDAFCSFTIVCVVGVAVCLGGGEMFDSTGGGGEVEGGEIGAAGGVS